MKKLMIYIENFIAENMKTIQFMSSTVDDFRKFTNNSKNKIIFDVKIAIENIISMFLIQLKKNKIEIKVYGDSFKVNSFESEFQQVILNLVNNAKDAIIENKVKNGKINIELKKNNISIMDNGGGIDENIIDKIFRPYFTTKGKEKGTGIGLYISKMIIENIMDGQINILNKDNGCCFNIKI